LCPEHLESVDLLRLTRLGCQVTLETWDGTMSRFLGVLLFFVELSWQQKDPLNDFCRRFGHQSAVVDSRLYLDGGFVDWNPIAQNRQNYTSKTGSLLHFLHADFVSRYLATLQ
jgi:hypothetical protein